MTSPGPTPTPCTHAARLCRPVAVAPTETLSAQLHSLPTASACLRLHSCHTVSSSFSPHLFACRHLVPPPTTLSIAANTFPPPSAVQPLPTTLHPLTTTTTTLPLDQIRRLFQHSQLGPSVSCLYSSLVPPSTRASVPYALAPSHCSHPSNLNDYNFSPNSCPHSSNTLFYYLLSSLQQWLPP